MRARVVIIVDVIPQGPAQVIFTDDDQMIETLSAYRADDAFGVWILER
jgi:Ni,Fe-hydrogenase maturation factor